MKQLLKSVVLAVVALVPLQPLLADGLCAPANCSSNTGATNTGAMGCCSEMNGAAAHPMSPSCQMPAPSPSTQSQQVCNMSSTGTSLQSFDTAKFKLLSGPQAVVALAPPVHAPQIGSVPLAQVAPGNHRDRYLLLEVFRI